MKKLIHSTWVFVFAFILSASAANAGNFETANNKIRHNGQQINLHGVSWFGLESPPQEYTLGGLDRRDYKEIVSQIKSLGFNAVRIPYCPDVLKNPVPTAIGFDNGINADLKNKGTLDILDAVVGNLNNNSIYILLDSHREDCRSIGQLWNDNGYVESTWIENLKFLANRYKGIEYFMGIDLKNEPHGRATWGTGNETTDWNLAAERAGKAVNQINQNILIFVQGIQDNPNCSSNTGHWLGGNLEPYNCTPINPGNIPANKLVLSPHVYGPDVYQQQYFFDTNFPNNMESIWESHFGYLTNRGLTIVPGEWGGKYGNQGGDFKDKAWQDSLVDYYIKKGICNSFYWNLNPNSSDTGGILQDDWRTPWQNKLELLKRYYDSCNSNNSAQINSQPVSQTPSQTSGSVIEVYALGTPAAGQYPNAQLFANGINVADINDIRGDNNSNSFVKFTFNSVNKIENGNSIEIRYVNDIYENGEDRNLRIDKVVIDGQTLETEAQGTYSEGSWSPDNGCQGGNKKSEWLHCAGFVKYNMNGNTGSIIDNLLNSIQVNAQGGTGFEASFFDNRWLSGTAKLIRNESDINNRWGYGQPDGVPADNFSIRWIKTAYFEGGNYRFLTESDDGMRIFVDGQIIFDQWNDHAPTAFNFERQISTGNHEIKVEYYENGGEAVARVRWERM